MFRSRHSAAWILGAVLALLLPLTGCSLQLRPGPRELPPLAAGGGVLSSDQGAASSREDPPASQADPTSQSSGEETPSFSTLPGGNETVPSASSAAPVSSSSVAPVSSSAPPAGSSIPAPSSSSVPPPSSSSLPDEPEEDPNPEEEDEPPSRPHSQSNASGSGGGSSQPAPSSQPTPQPESKPEPPSAPPPSSTPAPKPDPEPEPESESPSDPEPDPEPEPEPEPEPTPEPEPEPDPEPEEPDTSSSWQDLRVTSGGSTVSGSAVSIVAQIVQNEVGATYPDEAIKAQAVAAYTFVRYHNLSGSAPAVGLRSASDKVTRLVKEVAGEEILYNGKPILASYSAINAGQSASSRSVWGTALPYLVPVESEGDPYDSGFERTTAISASQVKSKLEKALPVKLDGVGEDEWFDILSYWDDGPYINEVRIGLSADTTGRKLRELLGLRSAAFEVRYDPGAESFDFITQGYGHGVGMSQVGAKYYANEGWDHVEILEHYYSGAEVSGG